MCSIEAIIQRIANLISVKSIVTVILSIVFAVLATKGEINKDFMTIYTVVIAFYFGSQSTKNSEVF